MKGICEMFFILLLITGCKEEKKRKDTDERRPFVGVLIDTLTIDNSNIRAITLSEERVWYAGDKGKYGYCSLSGTKDFSRIIFKDSIPLHFRSIAQNSRYIFLLSTEKPAILYKISKKETSDSKEVYEDKSGNAFYNGIQFWNESEGIAMGDPVQNKMTILITRNGGDSWEKVNQNLLPKLEIGEYAFAASNSSITVKGMQAWIATGGTKSRVLYTPDKGFTWELQETPMTSGKTMTGIYSLDFYNDIIGFMVGGDYEESENNFKNKALTINGGKSWVSVADSTAFGYASCVQFVPESGGTMLVALGPSGIYATSESGLEWLKISSEKDLYTFRFLNKKTAIAAGKNKIVKLRFTTR